VVTLLREFKIEDASLPLATLARELYTRPKIIHDIHPKKLEVLVAAVLADFFDVEVSVVGRTGDGGIDLVYLDGNIPCAVQVKRRQAAESKEQVSVVREFLGACVLKGFKVGKVVTTASGFTRGANTASREAVQKGILESFELISRERFLDLFRYRRGSYRYPWTASALEWSDLWQKYKRAIIHAEDIFLV
jgi:restriction endonuclease Mrr